MVSLLALSFMFVSCLTCASILEKEMIYSCEISVKFYRATQRYIPQDGIIVPYMPLKFFMDSMFPAFLIGV